MCELELTLADPGLNNGKPDCSAGNPCNVGTGNKNQIETDYSATGLYPLRMDRVYNSGPVEVAHWGSKWRGTYDRSIVFVTNGTISTAYAVRPDGKRYVFNLSNGSWVTLADVNDKLVRLVDANNNPSGWTYTNAAAEVETYDISGKLISITNRAGLTQTLTYNSIGLLSTVTDPFGRVLSFTYDNISRVTTMTDPAGGLYSYAYDDTTANGNLTSVTYPDGKIRTYLYGEADYVSATPASGVSYAHALTGLVDENGTHFATWRYDEQGRAISSEHGIGIEKVSLTFNADRTTTVVDSQNTARTYGFNNVLGVTKNTSRTQPAGAGSAAATTATTYDVNGNVASRTDWNGNLTTYIYDLTRNLETSRTEAAGTPQARTITTQWHLTYRLPTQISEPGRVTNYTYDANGNLLQKQIIADGKVRNWSYTYNAYGQILTSTGPRADVTTYAYDAQGNLASVTNPLGHVTQYTSYTAHGNPLTIVDPNGQVTIMSYDARQRLVSSSVGGETTSYTYDGVGQMTQVTLPGGSTLQYTYDDAHRLTGVSDNMGNRITYILDARSNRLQEQTKDPNGTLTRQVSRVYDALNRLQQVTGGVQ